VDRTISVEGPAAASDRLFHTGSATSPTAGSGPIGRTAKGELVYSMKCDNVPALLPQAKAREAAPAAEPEVKRGGIFGWSYDRRE
jgi:hypothetical protein